VGAEVNSLRFQERAESEALRSVKDLLYQLGIFWERRNTGVAKHKTGRPVRFGIPGTADIMATIDLGRHRPGLVAPNGLRPQLLLWIETKSARGTQSYDQKLFQRIVEQNGHAYLMVRSAGEVVDWLKSKNLWPP
jgi:hypothetical protein